MKLFGVFKKQRKLFIILSSVLLLVVIAFPTALFAQKAHWLPSPDQEEQGNPGIGLQVPARQTPLQFPQPPGNKKPNQRPGGGQPGNNAQQGLPTGPSSPGNPVLERLEQVTNQAFGDGSYVPNSWGQHKNRIIRTSSGDIYTVFISAGSGLRDRQWHLMHRGENGGWQEVNAGDAGTEPINILRGPDDSIHLFTWPGTQGQLQHLVSTDLGKTFKSENVPGQWTTSQGYSGSGINVNGDMVIFQSGNEQPGTFLWAYYSAASHQWSFHTSQFDFRYTYAFFFPGTHNDLTITAVRDVQREKLGYPAAGGFNYIFNAIKYFYISNVNSPNLTQRVVAQVQPQSNNDADVTFLTDSYVDTQGRTHILYYNQYDSLVHHIIVENGQVVKEVRQNIDFGQKARIFQDALGHYYIISTSKDGNSLNVYPGTASDTDGTQLNPPVSLNISQLPGCSNFDFCHSPNMTLQRSGHALSNYIDGVYGNYTREIYFRIRLREAGAPAVLSRG